MSKDPIGIKGGLNQYEFCASNPVMFVDPTGLDGYSSTEPDIGTAGVAGIMMVSTSASVAVYGLSVLSLLSGVGWGLVVVFLFIKVADAMDKPPRAIVIKAADEFET